MKSEEIFAKIKDFIINKKDKFIGLKGTQKISIIVGIIAVVLALFFGIGYMQESKYAVLFSGLDDMDAVAITQELESKKVDTKVEGDSIYVPKDQVDKLRLELSTSISNGSKGFELMDEGSSFGMTDEEFQIKKIRMLQGELERTIKTFPQVEDARVHITQGEESVFTKESVLGSAAVNITLKTGQELDDSQVRSIMSLVSASTLNVPKQNIEIIDQNMNLLSENLFNEDGKVNSTDSSIIDLARKAEKELSKELEQSVLNLLEPVYGANKVKVSVNPDLNFDTSETTELVINPDKVIVSESKSNNKTTDTDGGGGAVDNNMNNTAQDQNSTSESSEESKEYEVGKKETKTVKAQGEINRVTASVAIDGDLTNAQIADVEAMITNAIGIDQARGDSISVVSMVFNQDRMVNEDVSNQTEEAKDIFKLVSYIVGTILALIAILLMIMFYLKRKQNKNEIDIQEDSGMEMLNQKLEEIEKNRLKYIEEDEENLTLEEEVKIFASKNPDQVSELLNSWLNE